jgi:pimeloyl-ACP methyl ester carboxylesterase
VQPFSILVHGQLAAGLLGVPASGTSTVLVVICHGFGGTANGLRNQLLDLATRGYLAVAMDYRGPQRAWKVDAGADDTVAATRFLQARHPIARTVLWGGSMGGQVSGLAILRAPDAFNYWIDSVGVADLPEEWAVLHVTLPEAASAIEDAMSGTPADHPRKWADVSPALNATGYAPAASHLHRAYLFHASGDTLVPFDQGPQLALNLAAQGVAVNGYIVATFRSPLWCASVQGGPVCTPRLPQPVPVPAVHFGWGYDLVLARAASEAPSGLPFVLGAYDNSTATFVPPP